MPLTDAVLGVDSLVAGAAVAPLLRRGSHRLAAAALFGAADGAASSLGAVIAAPLQGLLVMAPALPALYGVYLIAVSNLAARGLHAAGVAARHLPALAVLGALAVALALDNLVASAATSGASVVATGCASAALMLLGLTAGGRIFDRVADRRTGAWIGAGLVLTACLAVVS